MAAPQCLLDIECFQNYFLIQFMRLSDLEPKSFELFEGGAPLPVKTILDILDKYEIITFNGNHYDIPMLKLALTGVEPSTLKYASNRIIEEDLLCYQFEAEFKVKNKLPNLNHVDLKELCIGKNGLKTYAGRLHIKMLMDLPFHPNSTLTVDQCNVVKEYCIYDLLDTKRILEELTPQIDLRREMSNKYKIDLRSKSDAQIAEAVIKTEMQQRGRIGKIESAKCFKYVIPEFIEMQTDKFDKVFKILQDEVFTVNYNGNVEMPKELVTTKIKIGKSVYQMGIGGLHSQEKKVNHLADENYILEEFDVTSYYPQIILNLGLYPKQLGPDFLDIYRSVVSTRIYAKAAGLKIESDALKIVVNGAYGKLGSKYSILYSPELLVQVTVTGQLSLLMLIESLETYNIHVVSANTDGIVVKCQKNRRDLMLRLIKDWETTTGFTMESSQYKALYSRDINNYIAIGLTGKIKTKGTFSPGSMAKNPASDICTDAVIAYLVHDTPVEETIRASKDITKFLTLRKVDGGAHKDGLFIGKIIRWYYAEGVKGSLKYRNNNNDVPLSVGAKPLQELPDQFPSDINYPYYIKTAKELLNNIGINAIGQMSLF